MRSILLLASIAATVVAESIDCQASRTDINGNEQRICQASYEGSNCPSPYTTEFIGVFSFCNRPCTDDETNGCNAAMCASYSSNCGPTTGKACQLAVEACKGQVTDNICNLAGSAYLRCQYTNLCQQRRAKCCPAGEVAKTYKVSLLNFLLQNGRVKQRLEVYCGGSDLSSFNSVVAAYKSQGGKDAPGLGGRDLTPRADNCGNVYSEYVINKTRSNFDDGNSVLEAAKTTCEEYGLTFASTKQG